MPSRHPGTATIGSPWGAFRAGAVDLPDLDTATLPLPAAFDANAPTPHPRGIVGLHRSNRPGSGSEFSSIRPFHPGDRLRRIHSPVSMRSGALHVTSTYTDEDAHVFLLVDCNDLGPREGIDGRPTSLDVTVRAAGAISEHFLRSNDRLTLRTVGAPKVPALGVGSGTSHLRRVLDALAAISPATDRRDTGELALRAVDPMALCLVLSPLVEPTMVGLAHRLAARGLTVVGVDTSPGTSSPIPRTSTSRSPGASGCCPATRRCTACSCAVSPWCPGGGRGRSTSCCATSPAGRPLPGWRGGEHEPRRVAARPAVGPRTDRPRSDWPRTNRRRTCGASHAAVRHRP